MKWQCIIRGGCSEIGGPCSSCVDIDAVRATIERHCHVDTRWPATARLDDLHVTDFIEEMRLARLSPHNGEAGER